MGLYRKNPIEVEMVQFTGNNWAEMHEFTGHVVGSHPDYPLKSVDVFRTYEDDPDKPFLWVAANQAWLGIEVGEWIAKDELGFYPIKDSVFQKSYTEVVPASTDEPIEHAFYYVDGAGVSGVFLRGVRGQWWQFDDLGIPTQITWDDVQFVANGNPVVKVGS